MCAALHDGDGGHKRQLGLVAQLGDGVRAAVAHGRAYFQQCGGHAVRQRSGVGDIGVHALLKGELVLRAAEVIALPVAGAGAALTPIFLHIAAADENLGGGGFVEAGEVAAKHTEIRAHREGEGDVVVLHNAAVGADGDIYARLGIILVTRPRHVDHGGGLSTANALCLAGDADGAAANADLDEIRSGLGQEAEALAIDDIARTDLYAVAVVLAYPVERALLPLGIALGGVDDEYVHTGLHQRRYALGIVAGVDTRTDDIALLAVEQLKLVGLVRVVVLTENKGDEPPLRVDDGQGVELVLPDNVVGLAEARTLRRGDELFGGGHELADGRGRIHAADAVVAAGDDAEKLAVAAAVLGDGHGGVTRLLLERKHVIKAVSHAEIRVAEHKARLMILHAAHHLRLLLNGLRDVDKGDTALAGERDTHLLAGHGLHDGGDHGDVHGEGTLLTTAELDDGGLERDVFGDILGGGIAGNEQVFAKGTGGFFKVKGHNTPRFNVFYLWYHIYAGNQQKIAWFRENLRGASSRFPCLRTDTGIEWSCGREGIPGRANFLSVPQCSDCIR